MIVTIEEATAQLAQLLDKAASGEEVTISREGASAIRLTPIAMPVEEHAQRPLRVPGLGKNEVWIAPDFDSPMSDNWLDEFYEEPFQ